MSFETIGRTLTRYGEERRHDLSHRASLSELMDEPCSYEELRLCLQDLARVNRAMCAYRATQLWLEQFVQPSGRARQLHIVDVGCGGGDMLRHIENWASHKQVAVRLIGIDLNPLAIRAAREFTPAGSQIEWMVNQATSSGFANGSVDLVISSLFTHHLKDAELVAFLQWMEQVTTGGWFINDLYRSLATSLGFKALATIVRLHRFVRHDGPVSILRGFRPFEWLEYASAAGISPDAIRVNTVWPGRISVARVKQP